MRVIKRADSQPGLAVSKSRGIDRLTVIRFFIIGIGLIVVARLFYLQIIRADYYKSSARAEQYRQLEIEPERGTISVMNGGGDPLVLAINESRFLIFADPAYVKDAKSAAEKLSPILSIPAGDLESKLTEDMRYVILAKKVSKQTKERIAELELKGVAWKEQRSRVYPQGMLAGQVLGFVNDNGEGQYGIEGYLNKELTGTPGQVKAITDVTGTPLALNGENVVVQPKKGEDIVLSIDQMIQRIAEDEIKAGVERSNAKGGSVIIMDATNGQIKAMANYPSYDPANYALVEDPGLFQNHVVSEPLEPGSIMKLLTMASAIDQGAVGRESTYFDPGYVVVDDSTIRNVRNLGEGSRTMYDIINWSLNTGAVYLLKQMGGGDINEQARVNWHNYLTGHYRLDQKTGVELEEESSGIIPSPIEGDGLRVQYANTAFGQGLSFSLLQYAAALSSVVNGGTYYQPTVIYGNEVDGRVVPASPKIVSTGVVSPATSADMVQIMKHYADINASDVKRDGFVIGGKTGTAQIAGAGGYREDVFNATYTGFVGRTKPRYVIALRLDEGLVSENFGGFRDGKPVFAGIVNSMMDSVAIDD